MKFRLCFLGFVLITASSIAQPRVVKLKEIEKILNTPSDKIQIINFWATWCGPCIKEMPLIEKIGAERNDINITLVSLDLELDDNVEKVNKFVDRKGLRSTVLILDEQDPNSWINKLDKEWTGSLPATIVINTKSGKRTFAGKELMDGELESMITAVK